MVTPATTTPLEIILASRVADIEDREVPRVSGVASDLGSETSALLTVLLSLLLEIDSNCSILLARILRVRAAEARMMGTSDSVMVSANTKLIIAGAGRSLI